jgi:hypothetical protein
MGGGREYERMERIAHETKYTGDVSVCTRVAHIFLEISNEFCLKLARWCARTGSPGACYSVRNRCSLPRRAHQLASADNSC